MNVTNIFTAVSKGGSSVVGYGSATLDDIITINFSIIKNPSDGRLFISWPNRLGKDKEGENKYFPHIFFTDNGKDFKKELDEAILESFGTKITTEKPVAKVKEEPKVKEESAPRKKLWSKPA